jgi:hypothetical protein
MPRRYKCKLLETRKGVLNYQIVAKEARSKLIALALKELPTFVHVSFS